MQTIEQVQAAWAALAHQAKVEAWDEFTRSIDYGDHGYDPFYLVLWPMWEIGASPFEDDDRSEALTEAALTAADNEYFDAQALAADPCDEAFWEAFTPHQADAFVGCAAF